jgi:hypothetical protein
LNTNRIFASVAKSQAIRFKDSFLHTFDITTEHYKAKTEKLMNLSENQLSKKDMILGILVAFTVISCPVHGALPTTEHKNPLMHYTKLISEEHFSAGRPLVIVLPLTEEDSTRKEEGHLIEELHTSGRWPILVFNTSIKMNENMYTDIHQHGSYIILISGPCKDWEKYISGLWQQLYELCTDEKMWLSRNPRAKFIVSVISNCKNLENIYISRAMLHHLWTYQINSAIVLFQKSNERTGNDLQQNTTDAAQDTYLELHTWYPYENSERCNPDEGTVPVKVFTVRNVSDIRRRDIFRGHFGKNLHGCALNVHVEIIPPSVYPPKRIWHNNSGYQNVYEDGIEIELIQIIGNSLNMTLDIEDTTTMEYRKVTPFLYAGRYDTYSSALDYITERTRGYLSVRLDWYTPCAAKHQRWGRFFNIFSVDLWMCFALSLVLAVITVICLSNYGRKSHLYESKSYSNISCVTSNIISVVLSVSVNTQPRSAPLRLFFFCWLWYSFAISTVFQAHLITFLIEPGYEEHISTVEEMLKSVRKFGFVDELSIFVYNESNAVDSAILNNAIRFPDRATSFNWAAVYQNTTIVYDNLNIEICRDMGKLTDENKRPLLCELEDGGVTSFDLVLLTLRGSPFLELINDIIGHTVESGILTHIKKKDFPKEKILSTLDAFALYDTYTVFGVRHLQTAFYLLMLGYVLALACFVTEIMWHRYRSKV